MILEAATAAAMYFSNQALAGESDIPAFRPHTAICRTKDAAQRKACLDRKMQDNPDPYQDMWDPNWVSSITYRPEDVKVDSAKAGATMLPKSHKEK